MGYSLIESVQLRALAAVTRKDSAYMLRQIFRWYSKTFFTPLHEVEALPMEDVLIAYYESTFEDMTPEQIRDAAELLLETPEQTLLRRREKDAEEAENFEAELQAVEQEKKRKKKRAAKKMSDVEPHKQEGLLSVDLGPAPSTDHLKTSNQQQPDVSLKFMDNEQLAALLAADEKS